jgi:two-component system chemotaxis sensor kinase CheA
MREATGDVASTEEMTPDRASSERQEPFRSRRGLSIHQKLLLLIVVLVASVVLLVAGYLPARQIQAMEASLNAKASTYARLASKQLESAVAFHDLETAREVFTSLAQDPDLESLTLFTARGDVLAARGSLVTKIGDVRTTASVPYVVRSAGRVASVASVVSLEGARGTIVVELSLARLAEERRDVQRSALLTGLVALLFGIAGATVIARSLSRRLSGIARAADAVAAGNLDQAPVEAGQTRDEIGSVAIAFNTMLEKIRSLVAETKKTAAEEKERLEHLVHARTEQLRLRNADLKLVLDNVGQGFVTLDLSGRMSSERSAVLAEWLGSTPESASFASVLDAVDPDAGAWFRMGWEALLEGILVREMALDQLPKRLTLHGRALELEYRPIVATDGELERVLVVVSDVTGRMLRERAETDERELTRLFTRAVTDHLGFVVFITESTAQINRIEEQSMAPDTVALKRAIHTLKGNAATYGIETVSSLCHALEDKLEEHGRLAPGDLVPLRDRWRALSAKAQPLMGCPDATIQIDRAEYESILTSLEQGAPQNDVIATLRRLSLEPACTRLSRLAEQATALGRRMGKPIEVHVEANNVRLHADDWDAFWSASVHLIRNALEHGVEPPGEREALGKPACAKIALATRLTDDHLTMEFSDTGRGIDWAAVERQARSRGLVTMSKKDLADALFSDGFSTSKNATELSGRGVGLGAVRQACEDLGGTVEVESSPGVGTTFRFMWPACVVTRPLAPPVTGRPRASTQSARDAHEERPTS